MELPLGEQSIYTVFITQNTEYHLRQDVCVAVRDRVGGRWLSTHAALSRRLAGAIYQSDGGYGFHPCWPSEGQSLIFYEGLTTSPVETVEHR